MKYLALLMLAVSCVSNATESPKVALGEWIQQPVRLIVCHTPQHAADLIMEYRDSGPEAFIALLQKLNTPTASEGPRCGPIVAAVNPVKVHWRGTAHGEPASVVEVLLVTMQGQPIPTPMFWPALEVNFVAPDEIGKTRL